LKFSYILITFFEAENIFFFIIEILKGIEIFSQNWKKRIGKNFGKIWISSKMVKVFRKVIMHQILIV